MSLRSHLTRMPSHPTLPLLETREGREAFVESVHAFLVKLMPLDVSEDGLWLNSLAKDIDQETAEIAWLLLIEMLTIIHECAHATATFLFLPETARIISMDFGYGKTGGHEYHAYVHTEFNGDFDSAAMMAHFIAPQYLEPKFEINTSNNYFGIGGSLSPGDLANVESLKRLIGDPISAQESFEEAHHMLNLHRKKVDQANKMLVSYVYLECAQGRKKLSGEIVTSVLSSFARRGCLASTEEG